MNIRIGYFPYSERIHPKEQNVKLELQESSLFYSVSRTIGALHSEISVLPEMCLRGYPVTKETHPRLYHIYRMVLDRLNCDQEYSLYVDFSYDLKAKTYGSSKNGHVIIVNSACVEEFNDEELAALLGHEIGHIQSDHIQTQELLESIHLLTDYLPIAGEIAEKEIVGYFTKWMVASELTADRFSVVACGSVVTVINLLLKQCGVKPDETKINEILMQVISKEPDNLGLFYLLMVKEVANFGMIQRIQELVEWGWTPLFKRTFPYAYYSLKNSLNIISEDDTDQALMLQHKRAAAGNSAAQSDLAKRYLIGDGGLSANLETGVDLALEASYHGNGMAQYLLYGCFKTGVANLKINPDKAIHLRYAAASRIPEIRKSLQGTSGYRKISNINFVIDEIKKKYSGNVRFLVDIDTEMQAKDSFWMMDDEPVYAAELYMQGEVCLGTAISNSGVYGRISAEDFPFVVTWDEIKSQDLCKRSFSGKDYIISGKQKIYFCRWEMKASLAEVLVYIKDSIKF